MKSKDAGSLRSKCDLLLEQTPIARPVLSQAEHSAISAAIQRVQRRFGWGPGTGTCEPIHRWQKRHRDVVLVRAEQCDHPMVIIKFPPQRNGSTLRSLHKSIGTAAKALGTGRAERFFAPVSLGWDIEPGIVVTPYVRGTTLGQWLADHWSNEEQVDSQIMTCGRALGRLHVRLDEALPSTEAEQAAAWHRGTQVHRRLALAGLSGMDAIRFRRGHGDFVTSNIIVDLSGRVAVIDFPSRLPFIADAEDIANFLFAIRREMGRIATSCSAGDYRRRQRELEDVFLAGYELEVPDSRYSDATRRGPIRMFEAHRILARVKIACRHRRLRSAVQHAMWSAGILACGRSPHFARVLQSPSF